MLKKFIERIDAIGENINPIVVRDMRRSVKGSVSAGMIIYSCLLVVTCLLVYPSADMDSPPTGNIGSLNDWYLPTLIMLNMAITALSVITVCIRVSQNLGDEMFLVTAITPRQYVHAYMFEMFITTSLWQSLAVPLVYLLGMDCGLSVEFFAMTAAMICGSFLHGQLLILIILSFIARLKRPEQVLYMFLFLYFCNVIFFPAMVPWMVLIVVWTHLGWQAIDLSYTFGIISICVLLPIGLLWLGVVAYKLSLYAFKTHNKSIVKMVLFNIVCYTAFSTFTALCYYVIAYSVFNFL
ncbi:MAG: hypothetical protein LBJ00_11680 [Planctomycetaceae bacterium]|jgi:hypothetical protein|nr:hypothetical protein [Planctomycetaceae bacterium]